MNRANKMWRSLKLLRQHPEGVTSLMITDNIETRDLYHKFSSRRSDLLDLGYMITEAEKVDGPDWNYRWKLLNPEYTTPEEIKHLGQPVYFTKGGQGEFAGIGR